MIQDIDNLSFRANGYFARQRINTALQPEITFESSIDTSSYVAIESSYLSTVDGNYTYIEIEMPSIGRTCLTHLPLQVQQIASLDLKVSDSEFPTNSHSLCVSLTDDIGQNITCVWTNENEPALRYDSVITGQAQLYIQS